MPRRKKALPVPVGKTIKKARTSKKFTLDHVANGTGLSPFVGGAVSLAGITADRLALATLFALPAAGQDTDGAGEGVGDGRGD